MQLSLYTLLATEVSLPEAITLAARAGFDAVDLRMHDSGAHLLPSVSDGEVAQIRRWVHEAGLHVSGLTTYYAVGELEAEAVRANFEGLQRALEIVELLGARLLRLSGPGYPPAGESYETVREAFREQAARLGQRAAERGLTASMEQHGGRLFASAGQIVDMMRGLPADGLGIVFDPGNCLTEGFEHPLVQVDMLQRLIANVHVKNGTTIAREGPAELLPIAQVKLDQGLLDWPAIVARLRGIGYDGYLTLEDFASFGSLREKFEYDVKYLRSLL